MCVLVINSPNITQVVLCPTSPPFSVKQRVSHRHSNGHQDSVDAAAMLSSLSSETCVEGEIVSKSYSLKLDEKLTNGELSTPFPQKNGFLSCRSPAMPTNGQDKGNPTLSISAKQFYPFSNSRKQLMSNVKETIHLKNMENEAVSRPTEYIESEVNARRLDFERNAKYMASLPSDDTEHAASPANRAVKKCAEYFNECVENSFAASYAPDPRNSLPSFHHTGLMPASTSHPAHQQASGTELCLMQKCGSEHSLAVGQDNLFSWLDASKVSMGMLCMLINVFALPINKYKHLCACNLFTHTHNLPSIHTLPHNASHKPTLTPTHRDRWTHTMILTHKDESCFIESINKNMKEKVRFIYFYGGNMPRA